VSRLSFLCAILLVLSALSLVSAQYRAQQLFVDLDRARAQSGKLDIDWRQLQLDQTNYSKNSLIEAAAVRDLRMQHPSPARTQVIAVPREHASAAMPAAKEAR
jgi:cell division protein FtsL